jgi:hypothetical protein
MIALAPTLTVAGVAAKARIMLRSRQARSRSSHARRRQSSSMARSPSERLGGGMFLAIIALYGSGRYEANDQDIADEPNDRGRQPRMGRGKRMVSNHLKPLGQRLIPSL